jgi:hypothetical protein
MDAHLEFIDTSWRLMDVSKPSIVSFVQSGKDLAAGLLEEMLGMRRKWRVRPCFLSSLEAEKALIAAGHKHAARWLKEGI